MPGYSLIGPYATSIAGERTFAMAHNRRPAISLLALLAIAMLSTLGCGSSQKTGGESSTLVAQADPICQQVAERRAAANAALRASGASTAKTLGVLARSAPGVATYEHRAIDQLSALKPPAALASDWRQMLAGMQKLADYATRLGPYALSHNVKGIQALDADGKRIRAGLAAIAARDGFTYCGRTS